MKAAQVVKYGDAVEGIELREVPEPAAPKSGEVLVGVEFSPINFNDLMVVWGIYAWKPELPATMGNEGAGKVIAVGEGVTPVKVGDRVCAVTRRRFPVGASPTRQPLQPEATGAGMEETKCLKPSDSGSRIGDRASVQAATRVNAEQASKRTMCRPTRQPYRGRLIRRGK